MCFVRFIGVFSTRHYFSHDLSEIYIQKMAGFATGFGISSSTIPGFVLENEKYKIQFMEVRCDEAKNIVSHGFEYCYDWRLVMELVLAATEKAGNDNTADIEQAAEDAMRDWMTTFQGWGLLSSIVPAETHRHVVLSLAYTSLNWDVVTGGDYTEEKVFDAVKFVYDNIEGKELRNLVPKFGIWFEEIVEGGEEEERMKNFTIFFNSKWLLEVKFVVEKKRVNRNLLELAAEAAVRAVERDEEIENLDIPSTLFGVVRDKFRDAEWVRNYWSFKAEIEAEDERDYFGELNGKLIWPVSYEEEGGSESLTVGKISDYDDKDDLAASAIEDDFVRDEQEHHITEDAYITNGLIDEKVSEVSDKIYQEVEEGWYPLWLFLCLIMVMGGVFSCF